jgi:hypothetical protein
VQINLQENVLRSLVVSVFVSSIRIKVPPALHRTYLLSNQNIDYVRAPLGRTNAYVGYTSLSDEHLRLWWAACADAKPEEAVGFEQCVGLLLDGMTADSGAGGGSERATCGCVERSRVKIHIYAPAEWLSQRPQITHVSLQTGQCDQASMARLYYNRCSRNRC